MSENEELQKILANKELLEKIKSHLENQAPKLKSNEELIEFWLDSKGYNKTTKRNYAHIMKFFASFLQQKIEMRPWNFQEITMGEIDSYKTFLERNEQLGINTKILYFKALESFYDFYQNQSKRANIWQFKEFPYFDRLHVNPKEIDIKNKEKKVVKLNPEETKLYLRRIFRIDKVFYLSERLQYESGLRFIDVARIKYMFLRLNQRHLFTEGRRGFRCYYLSKELVSHIKEFLLKPNKEYLFQYKNKILNYNTYLAKLKRMLKTIDFPKNVSTKSARKSFATNRHKYEGQARGEISLLLGHQIKTVTDRYIELEIQDYLKKFDDFNYLKTIF